MWSKFLIIYFSSSKAYIFQLFSKRILFSYLINTKSRSRLRILHQIQDLQPISPKFELSYSSLYLVKSLLNPLYTHRNNLSLILTYLLISIKFAKLIWMTSHSLQWQLRPKTDRRNCLLGKKQDSVGSSVAK